jgi:hypothetical protein
MVAVPIRVRVSAETLWVAPDPPREAAHHVGIVTGAYRVIHASGAGTVVEEPLEEAQRAMLSGAGRTPD